LVTHPLTTRRLAYDMMIMAFCSYEVLVTPLQFAGLVSAHTLLDVVMVCVWTADLVLGFYRGLQHYGVVDLRFRSTAWAYIKSWFLLDFTLVILDWSLLLTRMVTLGGVLRSSKTVRFWRVLKMFKFLRWYRMPRLYMSTQRFLQCDLAQTAFTIFSWIIGLFMLNHLIVCFWLLLGKGFEASPSWVPAARQLYMQQSHGEEPGDWYFYATALHWSVTLFTPASMEVTPRNFWERLYNLAAILISLVIFPTFLTSITNSVFVFRNKTSDYRKANHDLNKYLQDNRI